MIPMFTQADLNYHRSKIVALARIVVYWQEIAGDYAEHQRGLAVQDLKDEFAAYDRACPVMGDGQLHLQKAEAI